MRKLVLVSGVVMVSMLAACSTTTSYPVSTSPYPVSTYSTAAMDYGRIVNIEYLPAGTAAPLGSGTGILGAVVGGLAGAAIGSQIGGGSGRTAATILGGVGGAVVGNQIARNHQGVTTSAGYRITMQTDSGAMRTYEVPATGDLRVGDRVRVDNGVIYRA
jgi:outer membrane lipoprotein SlyB